MKNKTFFPHLDALRFFAFFAVFLNHALVSFGYYNPNPTVKFIQKNFFCAGGLGVSFFFVLSGFLITYLLLEEKENHGRIDIKKFYVRRILRIWPLYFLIVLLALFVFPLFKNAVPDGFPIRFATDQLNPWLYVGFAGNFDYLWNGISNVLIGILWSVSIEEQFYLFWPLIIAFVPTKRLLPTFILIIVASTLFRFYCTDGGSLKIITYHSFSCVSDLAIGAALAYLATHKKFIERIERMPGLAIEGIYFVGFALLPFRDYIWKFGIHYVHAAAILPILIAAFFAFVIIEQCYAQHSFFKAGNLKLISKIGTYSYGLYCYHMTVFFIVLLCFSLTGLRIKGISFYQLVITSAICLLLTIGIAKISYTYFEKKFLDLKKKFDT
jgi:peptidoglycan/LPS O-acetylase OafA/YrhL